MKAIYLITPTAKVSLLKNIIHQTMLFDVLLLMKRLIKWWQWCACVFVLRCAFSELLQYSAHFLPDKIISRVPLPVLWSSNRDSLPLGNIGVMIERTERRSKLLEDPNLLIPYQQNYISVDWVWSLQAHIPLLVVRETLFLSLPRDI